MSTSTNNNPVEPNDDSHIHPMIDSLAVSSPAQPENKTGDLTETDQRHYLKLVKRWTELQGAWFECFDILTTIREKRLYRGEYDHFEDFCRKKLGMTRANANRLLRSAEIAKEMETNVSKPTHEGHIRPLLTLENSDDRIAAYRAAAQQAETNGTPLTGRLVAKAVAEIASGRNTVGNSPKPQPSPNRTSTNVGSDASTSAGEKHVKPSSSGEQYKLADNSLAPLPCEGFLTAAQLGLGLGKLKLVAKLLDGGDVSAARVSDLERGFLTIMAAVFEIADADADQADKDSIVQILRSVTNTIETAT